MLTADNTYPTYLPTRGSVSKSGEALLSRATLARKQDDATETVRESREDSPVHLHLLYFAANEQVYGLGVRWRQEIDDSIILSEIFRA